MEITPLPGTKEYKHSGEPVCKYICQYITGNSKLKEGQKQYVEADGQKRTEHAFCCEQPYMSHGSGKLPR